MSQKTSLFAGGAPADPVSKLKVNVASRVVCPEDRVFQAGTGKLPTALPMRSPVNGNRLFPPLAATYR
jgi:hypothetical protein